MTNPFAKLVKREGSSLIRRGSTSLIKQAGKAGFRVEPSVITLGVADVVSHTPAAVRALPPRVLKVIGAVPPNPDRQAVLVSRVKTAISGVLTGLAAVQLLWDLWHESGIANDERVAIDAWFNKHGLRIGDPLSSLSPEELADLSTLIARMRNGTASDADIEAFTEVITHSGLDEVVKKSPRSRVPARPIGTGDRGLSPVSQPVAQTQLLARDVIDYLKTSMGLSLEALNDVWIRHRLLNALTERDFDAYRRPTSPQAGVSLLHLLEGGEDAEDGGEEDDSL